MYADDKFESGISMGIQKKKEINDRFSMEAKWDGYLFRNELTGESRFDMEDYAKINWKINEKLTLTNIFDYNDVKGTISLHRKKYSNTLYTINALNECIKNLNNGVLDEKFMIPWENFQNMLMVTNSEGLSKINTRIYKIVNI